MSDTARKEPTLDWDLESADYDTFPIRQQLGVLPGAQSTLQDRGVLKLDPHFDLYKMGSDTTLEFERMSVDIAIFGNRSAAMCTYCMFLQDEAGDDYSFWTHRNLVAVFQDILTSTRNPALALQAHYFTLLQMVYYDFLSMADVTTKAQLVVFEEALMPRNWRGYSAVVSVIFGHLLCVLLSVVLFSALTRLSSVGNSWESIGQAVTGEMERIVTSSTTSFDPEVKRRIRSINKLTNMEAAVFKVDEIGLGGRVGLVRQAD